MKRLLIAVLILIASAVGQSLPTHTPCIDSTDENSATASVCYAGGEVGCIWIVTNASNPELKKLPICKRNDGGSPWITTGQTPVTVLQSPPQEPILKVDELSPGELERLSVKREALRKAEKELAAVEREIRRAHGEDVREMPDSGFGGTTLECRSGFTAVELRGKYALKTTVLTKNGCY